MLLEICLEEEDLTRDERFLRCVALPGDQPGLALDRQGAVRWRAEEPGGYGLWVSADDRLILLRGEDAAPIAVSRGGRTLEAPAGKPVVLLDQDLLEVSGRRLRVHVHGTTSEARPPERLSASALGRAARAAATALALSAAVGAGDSAAADRMPPPIEVRDRPPRVAPRRQVHCTVTRITIRKAGPSLVYASCPTSGAAAKITVGLRGQLLDRAGAPLDTEMVTVKSIKAGKLVGEVELRQPVKAAQLRFHVY